MSTNALSAVLFIFGCIVAVFAFIFGSESISFGQFILFLISALIILIAGVFLGSGNYAFAEDLNEYEIVEILAKEMIKDDKWFYLLVRRQDGSLLFIRTKLAVPDSSRFVQYKDETFISCDVVPTVAKN